MLSEARRLALLPLSVAAGARRVLREMTLDVAGDAALSAFDAVLGSPRADEAVDRILASPVAEHAVGRRGRGGPSR